MTNHGLNTEQLAKFPMFRTGSKLAADLRDLGSRMEALLANRPALSPMCTTTEFQAATLEQQEDYIAMRIAIWSRNTVQIEHSETQADRDWAAAEREWIWE